MSNADLGSTVTATPTIPTQFNTDFNTVAGVVTSGGNAAPSANALDVFARDTADDNDNGIRTNADPNLDNNVFVELTNRVTGTVTTTDDTLTTLITLPLGTTAGVYIATGDLTAFNTTDTAGASYIFQGAARTDGAAGTEIAIEQKGIFEEAAMSASDFSISVTGNDLVVQVTGIAATTINWNGFLTYRFVS